MVIFSISEMTEKGCVEERYRYHTAKNRIAQHCAAISAIFGRVAVVVMDGLYSLNNASTEILKVI